MKFLIAAALLLLSFRADAIDLPAYGVRSFGADIGTLLWMNNHRDIVGYTRVGDSSRYFLLSDNVKTYLPANFSPAAINDDKVIAGALVIDDPEQSTWHSLPAVMRGGQLSTFPVPSSRGFATAINGRGDLAGFYYTESLELRAFSYIDERFRALPAFGPDEPSQATAINDAGVVAGNAGPSFGPYGFPSAWTGQDIRSLTGNSGTATAINERGTIVGFEMGTTSLFNTTAFIAYPDGRTQSWSAFGDTALSAADVNNADLAVGNYSELNSPVTRGLLFVDDTRVWLDDLIDPASGWRITGASAINDAGDILAYGCRADACSSVMLMPVPEPGGATLLGTGLLVLAGWRRKHGSKAG